MQITDSKTLKKFIIDGTSKIISFKKDNIESELFDHFQRFIVLKTIDKEWQDHLYMMDQLREGIGLRAYGQKNPLIEYKHEGFAMFESMMKSTNTETLKRIFRTDISSLSSSTSMRHSDQPRNMQAKANANILGSINKPQSQSSSSTNIPNFLNNNQKAISSRNKKIEPIVTEKKIGRNDKITIGKGSLKKTIKFKKVDQFINDGWQIID